MPKEYSTAYEHFFPAAPIDNSFQENLKAVLVSDKTFEDIFNHLSSKNTLSIDYETNSLDMENCDVVGIGVACSSLEGYYFPVGHRVGKNISVSNYTKLMEMLITKKLLVYNMTFDMLVAFYDKNLQSIDIKSKLDDMMSIKVFDVQILVYNMDSSFKDKGLKYSALHYLGRKVPTFEDVVGKKLTFDFIDPENAYYYAVCDVVNTIGLFDKLYPLLKQECRHILEIDNKLMKSMCFYSRQDITIDREFMSILSDQIRVRIAELEKNIYNFAGEVFKIDSKRDLTKVLRGMGLDTGRVSAKTQDMGLSEDDLLKISHPIAEMLIERTHLIKSLHGYIDKFSVVDSGHVSYLCLHVPSGRIASGNKNNPYYLPINYQNLTKSKPILWRTFKSDAPDSVFGWSFEPAPDGKVGDGNYYVYGGDSNLNVRRAITVPNKDYNNWIFMKCDYKQEEVVLAAGIFREKVWLDAFSRNEDVHLATAKAMYKTDKIDKSLRARAKTAVFGLLYGGTGYTLARSSGLPLEEANAIYEEFWGAMKSLKNGIKQAIARAYKDGGNVYTLFGRPRRLRYYLSSSDYKLRSYGERSVASMKVQGSAGDVMRIVLYKLYINLFHKYPDKVRFVGTVHDEIDLAVRKDFVEECIQIMKSVMELDIKQLGIKLNADMEFGYSYGVTFSFKRLDGEWVPDYMS